MQRVHHYGPSLTMLMVVLITLFGGPYLMRQLAWAEEDARVEWAAEKLGSSESTKRLAELSESFRQVAQRVEPSVVSIQVKRKSSSMRLNPFRGSPFEDSFPMPRDNDPNSRYDVPQAIGNGSGWVFDNKGHIITNAHVVRNADEIEVRFYDDTTVTAEVVGVDDKTDIAVLKVDSKRLRPAVISEKPVEQGEFVFAFGSPLGFDFSMSQGIVSGKGRRLNITGNDGYESFIQTDAAINPGNSGGPLANIYGEVVGMNSAIATRTGTFNGIGFAIPADMLKAFIPQLIDKGRVHRGYLGVLISDDPKVLKSFGVDKGVLIEDVMPNTPAAVAGMKRGDVITELDGTKTDSANDLRHYVSQQAPGSTIKMKVIRDGKKIDLSVKLAELPGDPLVGSKGSGDSSSGTGSGVDSAVLKKLGLEAVAKMVKDHADELNIEEPIDGVIVERVRPNSVAYTEGLMPGVVITEVQGKPVKTAAELAKQLGKHDLQKGVRLTVKVYVSGRWASRFIVLQLSE